MSVITSFTVSGVMRIEVAEIKPNGELVLIDGNNGEGKTSIMESLGMAIGGRDLFPEKPIRRGKKRAEIKAEVTGTNGTLFVHRILEGPGDGTVSKTSLKVFENKAGKKTELKAPQAILDRMRSALTIDPLAFTRLKPKEQCDMMKGVIGVNTDAIDQQYEELFRERTDVNRDLKEAKALLDNSPIHDGVPETEIVLSNALDAIREADASNAKLTDLKREADDAARAVTTVESAIQETETLIRKLELQIDQARHDLADRKSALEYRQKFHASCQQSVEAYVIIPTEQLRLKLADAEATNAKVRANVAARKQQGRVDQLAADSAELTKKLDSLKDQKHNLMESAKWPVPGLSFGENGIELNGLPLEQASSAERLRVSIAMGFAANPELKILQIRDGSLLDKKSLAMVADMAVKAGGQVWIERVGTDDPAAIIIEDGHVRHEPVETASEADPTPARKPAKATAV